MQTALKNFVSVTLVLIICVAGAWFYVRTKSLSGGAKAPLDHPFVQTEKLSVVAILDRTSKTPPLEQFDRLSQLSNDLVLWFDITAHLDGGLFLTQTLKVADKPKVIGLLPQPIAPSTASTADAVKFKDLVARYPKHRLILNFSGNRPGMEEEILRELDETKAGNRVLIQSPEDGLLRDLRTKRPVWIFGTSDAQVVQLKMLAVVGLASAAPSKGDVLVAGHPETGRPELRFTSGELDSMVREGHRRLMKVYVGPARSLEEATKFKSLGADGILTAHPEELLKLN